MKKSLFIISLKYPLLNSINIKLNNLCQKKADIIIGCNGDDYASIYDRIKGLNIFDKVYLVRITEHDGIKRYFQNLGKNKISLKKALRGTFKNILDQYFLRNKPIDFLQESVIKGENIILDDYDDIYINSPNEIIWVVLDYLVSHRTISCVNIIEGGANDYCKTDGFDVIRERYGEKLGVNVYLYDPDVVIVDKNIDNVSFKRMPLISASSLEFKRMINKIFDYDCEKESLSSKCIFFDQLSEPMPEYLFNANELIKFILQNSYKKHLKDHNNYIEKNKAIFKALDIISKSHGDNSFLVKLHPRTKNGISPELSKYCIGGIKNADNIPWEVYCTNIKFQNSIWMGIHSSAILNRLLCFEQQDKIKYIMLYKCIKYKNVDEDKLDLFYHKVQRKYVGKVFIPNSWKEFEDIVSG